MRIEVSVPGIRKERGKLPALTRLGALRFPLPLTAGPICAELDGPALCEPVTGTEAGVRVTDTHPVSANAPDSTTILHPMSDQPAASRFHLISKGSALLGPRGLRGEELPLALFDTASPLVSGNDDSNVIWASALACSSDFLLRLAGCQGKDLIA
jgi:hypothetical protein